MSEFSIGIRNYAGIPVVDLIGEIDGGTLSAVEKIFKDLLSAGHFNAMVNVKRSTWHNATAVEALERTAQLFQNHYGCLDIIAEPDQIDALRSVVANLPSHLLRFCTSEGQALMQIRRLPMTSAGYVTPMSARISQS